jgi:hypothetical protein
MWVRVVSMCVREGVVFVRSLTPWSVSPGSSHMQTQCILSRGGVASARTLVAARVSAPTGHRHAATLPVVTNTGDKHGLCHADVPLETILERLKYKSTAAELFKLWRVTVRSKNDMFAVDVPTLKNKMQVSLLRNASSTFERLGTVFSATIDGRTLFTQVDIERPESQSSVKEILSMLMTHQSLEYLDGLDLKLAGRVNGQWTVRIVKLKFENAFIRCVLRQDAGEPLLQALRNCCDWRAWPAVSAYSGELVESNSTLIIPGGVGACASCTVRVSDCWCREREEAKGPVSGSAHPHWPVCCGAARSESETRSRGLAS